VIWRAGRLGRRGGEWAHERKRWCRYAQSSAARLQHVLEPSDQRVPLGAPRRSDCRPSALGVHGHLDETCVRTVTKHDGDAGHTGQRGRHSSAIRRLRRAAVSCWRLTGEAAHTPRTVLEAVEQIFAVQIQGTKEAMDARCLFGTAAAGRGNTIRYAPPSAKETDREPSCGERTRGRSTPTRFTVDRQQQNAASSSAVNTPSASDEVECLGPLSGPRVAAYAKRYPTERIPADRSHSKPRPKHRSRS